MTRFYGKPTLFIRHRPDVAQYVCEPQRAMHVPFWYCDADETQPTDGSISTGLGMRLGSRITWTSLSPLTIAICVPLQNIKRLSDFCYIIIS